jgi:hypothetical protein
MSQGSAVRLAVAGLVAIAALGACQKDSDTKSGVVKPDATTSTTVASSTTTSPARATSSTTATTTAKATTTSTALSTTTTARAATTTTTKTLSYGNCAAVKAAGKAPLYRGDPGYSTSLDRDGDGVACET